MLRLLSTIIGQPVVSQREGRPVAVIREAVCDPSSAKVIAYRLGGSRFLAASDILNYLEDGMVIADSDAIQAEDDLIRVKRLGKKRTSLVGLRAVTEDGKRVGVVDDVLLETEGHFPIRFHIRPRFPRRLFASERIIPREYVIKMDAREIVVRYDGKARPMEAEPETAQ